MGNDAAQPETREHRTAEKGSERGGSLRTDATVSLQSQGSLASQQCPGSSQLAQTETNTVMSVQPSRTPASPDSVTLGDGDLNN